MLKSMINPDLSGKKTNLVLGFMLIILLAFGTGLMAGTYSGGSGDPVGTDEGPYQISNTDDLIELSNTSGDWGAYFIQTTDFAFDSDETEVDWNNSGSAGPAEGFSPIGNSSSEFTGEYDGDGYTIDNLFIDRPSTAYIGLFGMTDGAEINNLGVTNVDITGAWRIGGLVGFAHSSSIINNCFSSGSISYGSTGSQVGGLIGQLNNSSTITNCYSSADVDGISIIGGLVGENNDSYISNNYSTGNVTAVVVFPVPPLLLAIEITIEISPVMCYAVISV